MNTEALLAPYNVDSVLLRVLVIESQVHEKRPSQLGASYRKVLLALEIATNAHRRGGCTSGQLAELEKIESELKEMLS